MLFCEGGPQSALDQFWSYRWNMQMIAAKGYIVFAPNRRGVSGFGQEWKEQISGDYGGKNIQDYLDATDAMAKEPYIDAKRMGAVGASYGGYSVFYLAGVHQGRFKAFVSHAEYSILKVSTDQPRRYGFRIKIMVVHTGKIFQAINFLLILWLINGQRQYL